MANEKELQLDGGEGKPGSKKKLIIIIVAILLVVGIGVGAAIFLMSGDDSAEETEESVAAAETAGDIDAEPAEAVIVPAIYIKLKPEFIVNYQVGPRQRYLQVYMEAMTRNPAVADAIEMHSPMIRGAIISLLSRQEFEYLRSAEGRANIRKMVTEEVNRLVAQETGILEGLDQILFTNYVMQ